MELGPEPPQVEFREVAETKRPELVRLVREDMSDLTHRQHRDLVFGYENAQHQS